MKIIYLILALFAVALVALLGLRLLDSRADREEWARLKGFQPDNPIMYDPEMVAELPEPVQRYFNFTIAPGTPLYPVVEINMGGQFSLGSKDSPDYQAMKAHQILAAPHGFVWRLDLPGRIPVSGSDSGNWTRFRILGLFPVARIGGDANHARSAYGRCVAESVFWAPAALLPGPGVTWEAVDSNTARVKVSHGALSQSVEFTIDAEGRPNKIVFMRWSNANPDKVYRLQPFGGLLSDFREVQGYRLPFRVEAGNMFGTDDYFAFYKAVVSEIRFPESGQ